MSILNDEIRSYIGREGEPVTAPHPLSEDALRRFVQAVMETDPVHWDPEAAAASRYGEVVATPLQPLHAFVRPPGSPDPADALLTDPDWDGVPRDQGRRGLPAVPLPLTRMLNGGTEARFHQLAAVGDVITARSRYADIQEKEGRSGPMVIVKQETRYTNQRDELLAVVTTSAIMR
jgi:acyl dehydratase